MDSPSVSVLQDQPESEQPSPDGVVQLDTSSDAHSPGTGQELPALPSPDVEETAIPETAIERHQDPDPAHPSCTDPVHGTADSHNQIGRQAAAYQSDPTLARTTNEFGGTTSRIHSAVGSPARGLSPAVSNEALLKQQEQVRSAFSSPRVGSMHDTDAASPRSENMLSSHPNSDGSNHGAQSHGPTKEQLALLTSAISAMNLPNASPSTSPDDADRTLSPTRTPRMDRSLSNISSRSSRASPSGSNATLSRRRREHTTADSNQVQLASSLTASTSAAVISTDRAESAKATLSATFLKIAGIDGTSLSRRGSVMRSGSSMNLAALGGSMSNLPVPLAMATMTQSQVLKKLNLHAMYLQTKQLVGAKGGVLTPAEWWRFAILSVTRAIRALGGFNVTVTEAIDANAAMSGSGTFAADVDRGASSTGGSGQGSSGVNGSNGAPAGGRGPVFSLSEFTNRPAFIISTDMRQTLDKHRSEYTEEDFVMIERLTEQMPSFQKYAPDVRKQLCRKLQYERFGPGRIMIKQGHDPKSFYFILNGRVQVYKMENGVRIDLNELISGDSFGELAILKDTKRNASVKCLTASEFFRIDKDDFLEVLKETAEDDIRSKVAFFQTIPFLTDMSTSNLSRLAELCSKRDCPTNAVIVREREAINYVHLIRSGSVRVLRIVPFRKIPRGSHRYSLEPCMFPVRSVHHHAHHHGPGGSHHHAQGMGAGTAASGKHDSNVVYKLLCIGTLGPGQYFGQECILASLERRKATASPIPGASGMPGSATGATSPSAASASALATANANGPNASIIFSPHSIVTCEPTEVFRISKVDFLKLMTPKALSIIEAIERDQMAAYDPSNSGGAQHSMHLAMGMGVPLRAIQDAFVKSHQWAHYRTRVMDEIVKEKRAKREVRGRAGGAM